MGRLTEEERTGAHDVLGLLHPDSRNLPVLRVYIRKLLAEVDALRAELVTWREAHEEKAKTLAYVQEERRQTKELLAERTRERDEARDAQQRYIAELHDALHGPIESSAGGTGEYVCEHCGATEPEEVTGGVRCMACRYQPPECTCYEMTGGHQPGCAFNRCAGGTGEAGR